MVNTNKKIILIDDDKDIITLIERMLTQLGFQTLSFQNGSDFLEQLIRIRSQIGLILLDLQMPSINGLVILKKMQDMRKHTQFKVCVLSAYNDPAILNKAKELGADTFLIKPFEKTNLVATVRELMQMQLHIIGKDNFAKTNYTASLINSPFIYNFKIIGINNEKILIESTYNFRNKCDIYFECHQLSEILNSEKNFKMHVTRSRHVQKRFILVCEIAGIHTIPNQNLKLYVNQHGHQIISYFDPK